LRVIGTTQLHSRVDQMCPLGLVLLVLLGLLGLLGAVALA
jgi:hypothetical protein